MKTLARTAALTILAVVALSGCIRYDVDMKLAPDGTASGVVIFAIESGSFEDMGVSSDEEALEQTFGESPFDERFVEADYVDGDWVGKSYTFDSIPVDELVGLEELFAVTKVGDEFVLDGPDAPMSEDERAEVPPGAESKVSVTFPGKVTEHNGELSGNTVTWDLFAMSEPLHAKGGATGSGSGGGSSSSMLLIGGVVLLVLIGAAIAFVLLRRKGASGTPTASSYETAPPPPSADFSPSASDAPAPPAPPIAEGDSKA